MLSHETNKLLESYDTWFAHLENYRHSLAHRIPVYIVPYCVDPKNEDEYRENQDKFWLCLNSGDVDGANVAEKTMESLGHFIPWYVHSFEEGAPTMMLHPQVVVDALTLATICDALKSELLSI